MTLVRRILIQCLAASLAFSANAQLPDFTSLPETSSDAVVNVTATIPSQPRSRLFDIPFFGPFRQPKQPDKPQSYSQGSGFVIDEDGFILTNHHVIEDATIIVVTFNNEISYEAELIGSDERADVALIRIIDPDDNLPVIKIGDSSKLKVGQWVAAIGSPYGLDQTITSGIISALQRSLPRENQVPFIQTDAAVNPGNSGGPLVNLDGEVVGINSQIISPVRAFVGASLAIPINIAMNIQEKLRSGSSVRYGFLGLGYRQLDAITADAYGLDKKTRGVLIGDIEPDSPAAALGLQTGDIILQFNGETAFYRGFAWSIASAGPGAEVSLTIWRDGEELEFTTFLAERTDRPLLGLLLKKLTDVQKQQTGLEFGVFVRDIMPDRNTPSDISRFRKEDIITHMLVNTRRKSIEKPKDVADALEENTKEAEVFYVWRKGRNLVITVRKNR